MLQVKLVISFAHGLLQVPHIPCRMKLLPWPRARASLAAFKREQEAVQSRAEPFDGPPTHRTVGVVKVVQLVRIVLSKSATALGCHRQVTHCHVIQLVLICAPNCIRQIVFLPNDTHVFVRVVYKVVLSEESVSFD